MSILVFNVIIYAFSSSSARTVRGGPEDELPSEGTDTPSSLLEMFSSEQRPNPDDAEASKPEGPEDLIVNAGPFHMSGKAAQAYHDAAEQAKQLGSLSQFNPNEDLDYDRLEQELARVSHIKDKGYIGYPGSPEEDTSAMYYSATTNEMHKSDPAGLTMSWKEPATLSRAMERTMRGNAARNIQTHMTGVDYDHGILGTTGDMDKAMTATGARVSDELRESRDLSLTGAVMDPVVGGWINRRKAAAESMEDLKTFHQQRKGRMSLLQESFVTTINDLARSMTARSESEANEDVAKLVKFGESLHTERKLMNHLNERLADQTNAVNKIDHALHGSVDAYARTVDLDEYTVKRSVSTLDKLERLAGYDRDTTPGLKTVPASFIDIDTGFGGDGEDLP